LLLALLLARLVLVQPLQCALVHLVEPPRLLDGDVHQVHAFRDHVPGLHRAHQDGGVRLGEAEFALVEQVARGISFLVTLKSERDVSPASESVRIVPY